MASKLLFLLVLIISTCYLTSAANANAKANLPKFSSILIFGDSTVDTGNNDFIPTLFKANHPPYGQDFPGGIPTGRFSNGKLIPDFLASFLGIKQTVPPFLDPRLSNDEYLTGVCFASAGSGFDNLTNAVTGGDISVSCQLGLFKRYKDRVIRIVGETEAMNIIKNSLVVISAGTNDIGFNYHNLLSVRRMQFDAKGYQDFLHKQIQDLVKALYDEGCRTIVIAGLPPMGCLPLLMTERLRPLFDFFVCSEDENAEAKFYNQKLVELLPGLQAPLPGTRIIYADVYTPLLDMINHPQTYGFIITDRGCCGTGLLEGSFLCNSLTPACEEPSEFIFWDSIHPSEAAYRVMANFLQKQLVQSLQ